MQQNDFLKQFANSQNVILDQLQKSFKVSEEYSKKAVKTFSEQIEKFNEKNSQFAQMVGTIEENNKKMQEYFADLAKNSMDQKSFQDQLKQLEVGFEVAYKNYMEQAEKNLTFLSEKMVAKSFENALSSMKNSSDSMINYMEEQFSFMVNFQKDLTSGMKSKEYMKDVPSTIAKYSQELVESSSKNVLNNVKSVLEANSKAVSEGVKSVLEANSKAVSEGVKTVLEVNSKTTPAKATKKTA